MLVMRSEPEQAAAFVGLVAGLPREGSSEVALTRVRFVRFALVALFLIGGRSAGSAVKLRPTIASLLSLPIVLFCFDD